jgi:hypothetical protein
MPRDLETLVRQADQARAAHAHVEAFSLVAEYLHRWNDNVGHLRQAVLPRFFTGPDCLLLDAARQARSDPSRLFDPLNQFLPGLTSRSKTARANSCWLAEVPLFQTRVAVIEAAVLNLTAAEIQSRLAAAVATYNEVWHCAAETVHPPRRSTGDPGFLRLIPDKFANHFDGLRKTTGDDRNHSSLWHIGETLAGIWGDTEKMAALRASPVVANVLLAALRPCSGVACSLRGVN